MTAFLFGFHSGGQKFKIATNDMFINGSSDSALMKFLTSLLGRKPEYGWDYLNLKGTKCQIRIEHKPKRNGGFYPVLAEVRPIKPIEEPQQEDDG